MSKFLGMIGFVVCAWMTTACVALPPGETYGSYSATARTTGVFLNGQELGQQDKAQLDAFLGTELPAGRYVVTNDGMMGVEGSTPTINLVAIAEARRGSGNGGDFNMISQGVGGTSSISSSGGCTILSTPSGSLSSGC
jgi:hypothetical protein